MPEANRSLYLFCNEKDGRSEVEDGARDPNFSGRSVTRLKLMRIRGKMKEK